MTLNVRLKRSRKTEKIAMGSRNEEKARHEEQSTSDLLRKFKSRKVNKETKLNDKGDLLLMKDLGDGRIGI